MASETLVTLITINNLIQLNIKTTNFNFNKLYILMKLSHYKSDKVHHLNSVRNHFAMSRSLKYNGKLQGWLKRIIKTPTQTKTLFKPINKAISRSIFSFPINDFID